MPLLNIFVFLVFTCKHVSDTSDFKQLQKYATFGADSDVFDVLSNEVKCSEMRVRNRYKNISPNTWFCSFQNTCCGVSTVS